MADNVAITAGSGTTIATDDVTGVHFQRVKLVDGTLDSSAAIGGDATNGLDVDVTRVSGTVTTGGQQVRVSVTPTVSTSPAYTAKDAVGGLLTFANAVRSGVLSGLLQGVTVIDKGQQMAALDLVLFDRTFTASTDNAIFAPSDADLANAVAVVPLSAYSDFSTNSLLHRGGLAIPLKLNGTSLYGQLVTRGTPTYTSTSDLIVIVAILQD